MHGFRHRFKTIGLEAGISTRVLDAIQGHAARTAGDSYGDVTVKAIGLSMTSRYAGREGMGRRRLVCGR
jgi:site-specific recombinase XerD